jgi:hypothetical protein
VYNRALHHIPYSHRHALCCSMSYKVTPPDEGDGVIVVRADAVCVFAMEDIPS